MRPKRKDGKLTFLRNAFPFIFIVFVGLTGFFMPYFIDSIPFFKAKKIVIYGNQNIPLNLIAKGIDVYKGNWLFMSESGIKKSLEDMTGNAVASVVLKKHFSKNGVDVDIFIKERKPIAVLVDGNKTYLIDKDGDIFEKTFFNTNGLMVIYTYNLDKFQKDFKMWIKPIYFYLDKYSKKDIFITDSGIVVSLNDINAELILPFTGSYTENELEKRISFIASYPSSYLANKIIDLRYDKFIVVKNKGNSGNNLNSKAKT